MLNNVFNFIRFERKIANNKNNIKIRSNLKLL